MKTLNLTHDKLACFPVELDEFGLIHVLTPTKGIFEELVRIVPTTQNLTGKKVDADTATAILTDVYNVCSTILSRNMEKTVIAPNDVERILSISDVIVFIEAYISFVTDAAKTNEKN